jgi:trans-aconitate methyltransferase
LAPYKVKNLHSDAFNTIVVLTSSEDWNAAEYHRVSDPQVSWGRAVLARLDLNGQERVVDAGCGTGRLTKELAARLPRGVVVGLDASPQMLAQARAHLADAPTPVHLVQASLPAMPIRDWADVVFSTATFHWVPDHPRCLPASFKPSGPAVCCTRSAAAPAT